MYEIPDQILVLIFLKHFSNDHECTFRNLAALIKKYLSALLSSIASERQHWRYHLFRKMLTLLHHNLPIMDFD